MGAPITPISPLPFVAFTATLPNSATVVQLDPQPFNNTKEVILRNLDLVDQIFVKTVDLKEENAFAVLATKTGPLGGFPPFLSVGDTTTIGGSPLTAVAGARTPGANDFSIAPTTLAAQAAEIAAAINDPANAFAATLTATSFAPLTTTGTVATVRIEVIVAGSAGNATTIVVAVANAGALTLPVNGGGVFVGGEDALPSAASVSAATSIVIPPNTATILPIGSEGNRQPLATTTWWAVNQGSGLGIVAKAAAGANLSLNVTYIQSRGYPDGV
jgi:hypothetical protein